MVATRRKEYDVPLIVDSREPETLVWECSGEGFDVSVQTLTTGDFLWLNKQSESVAVERKTIGDLLSSLAGKQENGKSRAINQLTRMKETYQHPVLLLEGAMSMNPMGKVVADGRTTSWSWDAIDNFLLTVQQFGIVIARCKRGKVPQRLMSLRKYFDKVKHQLPLEESCTVE